MDPEVCVRKSVTSKNSFPRSVDTSGLRRMAHQLVKTIANYPADRGLSGSVHAPPATSSHSASGSSPAAGHQVANSSGETRNVLKGEPTD